MSKEWDAEVKDSLLREAEKEAPEIPNQEIDQEKDQVITKEENTEAASLYGDSSFNPFNKSKSKKLRPKRLRVGESWNEMIKKEIKSKKMKRSRATSFHFGSETPDVSDNSFSGFDWAVQDESKTPLQDKKSSRKFSFQPEP